MTTQVILDFGLILVGFIFLIKGADLLVLGASSLAKRMHVSDIVIGLTVVAMGTSAPELVVNLVSGSGGHQGVIFGNIIGSNIINIYLILGLSSVVYPIAVQKNVLYKDIPYCILAMLFLFVMVNDKLFWNAEENTLSFIDGLVLVGLFVVFLVQTFWGVRKGEALNEVEEDIAQLTSKKTTIYIILGVVGLIGGGNMVVGSAVAVAEFYGIGEDIIGLTILAAGTSLPELATSIVASYHRKADLAIGNIVGSNIFNILFVLGTTTLSAAPLVFDTALNLDMYVMLSGMILVVVFMYTLKGYKIDRLEGIFFLICFLVYSYYLIQVRAAALG